MTTTHKQLVRMKTLTGVMARGKSAIYKQVGIGTFPAPFKLGPSRKISAWDLEEAQQILKAEVAGKTNDELRGLVKTLVEKRDNR